MVETAGILANSESLSDKTIGLTGAMVIALTLPLRGEAPTVYLAQPNGLGLKDALV